MKRDTRFFTVAEANALLPELRGLLEELAGQRALALQAGERLRRSLARAGANGGGETAGSAFHALEAFAANLASIQKRLEERGVLLKDAGRGLLDFPALREGRPVYLCWQLGEDQVRWWHDQETGFAGRQPLRDEDDED